uniref:F-box domain-containing protein n=1 Tax=Globodera rostochiensis TaxID=31243 RepID=A0A914HGL6_GLORO
MTAALLMGGGGGGGGTGVPPQRRLSATFVFEMSNQRQRHQQQQLQQQQQQQQSVPPLTALVNGFTGGESGTSLSERGGEQQRKRTVVSANHAQQRQQQQQQQQQQQKRLNWAEDLPSNIWQRIGTMAGPLDRMRMAQCCKRMRDAVVGTMWTDVLSLDIRQLGAPPVTETNDGDAGGVSVSPVLQPSTSAISVGTGTISGRIKKMPTTTQMPKKAFRIRMSMADGRTFRLCTEDRRDVDTEKLLKTLLERIDGNGLRELTIWDACLSDKFRGVLRRCCTPALRTLRLWNCGRYLADYASSKQRKWPAFCPRPWRLLLPDLLALPHLRRLHVLDSVTPEGSSSSSPSSSSNDQHQFPDFSDALAKAINAPLEELQLTACRLPLSALQLLRFRCAHSLRRLAIGCTWGNERKRELYLRELSNFKALADLDLPPFLFCLANHPKPDQHVQQLFEQLPQLKAIGFRHSKSSVLFRFIEHHLPDQIRALRVHHSVHRMPNFAELGHPAAPPLTSPKPCLSIRSGSILFGHGTGSPDSQRGLLQKKGSIVSQRSSLLSSSYSSVRSDSVSSSSTGAGAAAFQCHSSSSLRSAGISSSTAGGSATVVPVLLRRSCQPGGGGGGSSTVTGSSPAASSSTITSSTSSLGGHHLQQHKSPPSAQQPAPAVGQHRCKSLSLGGEVGGACGGGITSNSSNTVPKKGSKSNSMPSSSTWCTLSTRPTANHREGTNDAQQWHLSSSARDDAVDNTAAAAATAQSVAERLARRRLTIVAVAEERIGGRRRRQRTDGGSGLREHWHSGIKIVYVCPSEARHSQDVLGRMGSPIEAPFMYYGNKSCAMASAKNEKVRFVDGDIVCPLPLSEFGMESDYENEEDEADE